MKRIALLAGVLGILGLSSSGQSSVKPGYIPVIPAAFKKCGAKYTFDSITLNRKKFILVTDFQDRALIMIGGKTVALQLTDTKVSGNLNVVTYTGKGYIITLSTSSAGTSGDKELETGQLVITKAASTKTYKIHGESSCDESAQEGNQ